MEKRLEDIISQSLCLLMELQALVKLGVKSTNSCIIDDDLFSEEPVYDYYVLLKSINTKLKEIIRTLDV